VSRRRYSIDATSNRLLRARLCLGGGDEMWGERVIAAVYCA
jgi:hypothetical protein